MENLGSKIEKVAKPIAKKLGLKSCKTCDEVRDLLNDGKFLEALKKRIGLK